MTTFRRLNTRLIIRLDEPTVLRLDSLVAAGEPGLNRSDLIRSAIRMYLDAQDKGTS